jgi:hypothetical protein
MVRKGEWSSSHGYIAIKLTQAAGWTIGVLGSIPGGGW